MLLHPQCSFGFIYEREQLEATCPQCHQTFCVRCKRQVRHIHPFRNNLLKLLAGTVSDLGFNRHERWAQRAYRLQERREGGLGGGTVKGKVKEEGRERGGGR